MKKNITHFIVTFFILFFCMILFEVYIEDNSINKIKLSSVLWTCLIYAFIGELSFAILKGVGFIKHLEHRLKKSNN